MHKAAQTNKLADSCADCGTIRAPSLMVVYSVGQYVQRARNLDHSCSAQAKRALFLAKVRAL